jgi:DnaJ-class molecular chaperone
MNHYDTLGVPRDASPEDIKRAFRRERSKAHPDREGGDKEQAASFACER